jgi:TonB family protein
MGVRRLRSSISLSVFLHALLFLTWAALVGQQAARAPRRETILVELDPRQALERMKKKADESNDKRIVQTQLAEKSKQAAKDAYLGEQTQIVDRQTVGRTHEVSQAQQARAPKAAARRKELAEARPLSKFGIPILPDPKERAQRENDRSDWLPAPGSLPQDYVKGLKESDRTALNTREYVFFGYFQRIRQKLDRAWTGQLRDQLGKLYRAGRQLASEMEHTTRVLVTLNRQGEIVRVQIVEESGTHDLDEAAVRAFNQAGPFPNPPRGIVDAQGLIQLRWDFILRS